MEFRKAEEKDLVRLQPMYRKLVAQMIHSGLRIWDDIYPCCALHDDISSHNLYMLVEASTPVAAFALCERSSSECEIEWENPDAKAVYLDRLGVAPDFAGRGLGSFMLEKACALARERGAEYLRLFVVETNAPAISLYLKNGFSRASGVHVERIDAELSLCEFGFEIKL